MGKITDIAPQKKNPKRVSIFLDEEFAFGVSLNLRFEKKLESGQSLSEKQIANLIELDQVERLVNKALRFLSFRPRSEKEIRDHLLRKGKLKDIHKSDAEKSQYEKSVEKVIAKLKKLEQINDKEFAKWWVEQRGRFKPRGERLVKVELFQKGIDRDVIDEVVKQGEESNEEELAKKAALKKLSSYRKLNYEDFRNKMGQFLARRGFSWNVVKKVVDTMERNR
jgi:regulatory protein